VVAVIVAACCAHLGTESKHMQRRTFFAVVGAAIANSAAHAKIGHIELGVCGDAAHFDAAVRYGFDYYEPEVAEIARMKDEQFAALKERVLASPIRCRAFRSFIRTLQVVGDNVTAHEAELKDSNVLRLGSRSRTFFTSPETLPSRTNLLSASSHCANRRATSSTLPGKRSS